MDLYAHQQTLAGMIKGSYAVTKNDDPYFQSIGTSQNLTMARHIIVWWRQVSIERYCRLTSSALKQLGLFEKETKALVFRWDFSPYVEELANMFLDGLKDHDLSLVSSLAQFERALIQAVQGEAGVVEIKWSQDPYAVLSAVTTGSGLDSLKSEGEFVTLVSNEYRGLFRVEHQQAMT